MGARIGGVLAMALAACSGPAAAGPGGGGEGGGGTRGARADAVHLSLQVNVRDAQGQLAPVAQGDTLHTGEFIELLIGVDRPAYVYLLQFFADGSAAVLFPEGGDVQLQPGSTTRVPGAGDWFQLDDATGEEHIYVVVSTTPIAESDRAVAERVEAVRRSKKGDLAAGGGGEDRPPAKGVAKGGGGGGDESQEEGLSLASRGLVKVSGDGKGVRLTTDAQGIGVLHFWFKHGR